MSFLRWPLHNQFFTGILFVAVAGASLLALKNTPVDALPDLSENQVVVMTEWSGQSPQNVEDQVTYPLSVAMQNLAGVKDVRSMSQLGISMVTIVFEDNIDIYFARDRVSERLNQVRTQLPNNAMPVLGPDASGLGHVMMYTLESNTHSLTELRSIQDFIVRYELQSLPGVAEVASVGGHVKTYQVIVDPLKLQKTGVSLIQVITSIQQSNNTVSGKVIDTGSNEVAIQANGFFQNAESLLDVVVGNNTNNQPIFVRDVGFTRESGAFRRGILADAEQEKVGGIVVMRYGENPLQIIERVQQKLLELKPRLPAGVSVDVFYDRTELITKSIKTLIMVLWQELLITTIIILLFLRHWGATLITASALLMGVLMTFLFMYLLGIPSNIMSLGGIAIAIGTMVDAAIVISESIYRKLTDHKENTWQIRRQVIFETLEENGKAIIFAIFIIIFSFIPIFALEGMEGKLFSPLAWTNIFAMLGALLASLFLVPTLALFGMRGQMRTDDQIPLMRWLLKKYTKLLQWAFAHTKIVFGATALLVIVSLLAATRIGSEFMPPLDEGSVMYMPVAVNPGISEERITEMLIESNQILSDPLKFPEVAQVVGKAGRAQTATDPAPLAMIETFITLKPKSQWPAGVTKQDIVRRMSSAVRIEGLGNGFTQPIRGRIDMIATGIQGEVGIKVFGPDAEQASAIAAEIKDALYHVPGAVGIQLIPIMGLDYLDITLNDDAVASYGIRKSDALQTIAAGVGSAQVTTTIKGREQYGIEVAYPQSYRQNIEDIRSLELSGINGQKALLIQVADIKYIDGPSVIRSENGLPMGIVQMSVSGLDTVSFVENAKQYIAENITLPAGYRLEFAGQYENQVRATERLMLIVPMVFMLIFTFLYIVYRDILLVALALFTIPVALVGGILALYFGGYNFSVAVWVGLIVLFGNAVETGVVILVYLQNAIAKLISHTNESIQQAIFEGATLRLRPVLMTAFTSIIGLLPLLITTGVGSEVQKPLAVVVVFGLITSISITLIVLPLLYFQMLQKNH